MEANPKPISDTDCLTIWGLFPVGSVTLRVCAWCSNLIGDGERCAGAVSHAMCQSCHDAIMAELDGVRIAE